MTVRWTAAAASALALLGACSHPHGSPAASPASAGQMMQCAASAAANVGYSAAPDENGPDRMHAEKQIPPEGGYPASVGIINAWVDYGRDGLPRLKVRGQRVAQGVSTPRSPRRLPGNGPGGVPLPGGTVAEPAGSESSARRIPLGRVATDAAHVETTCRGS